MEKPTCSSCVYWEPENDPPETFGNCHRHAPPAKSVKYDHEAEEYPELGSSFPVLNESEWCGEHQDFVKWMLDRPREETCQSKPKSDSSAGSGTTACTTAS